MQLWRSEDKSPYRNGSGTGWELAPARWLILRRMGGDLFSPRWSAWIPYPGLWGVSGVDGNPRTSFENSGGTHDNSRGYERPLHTYQYPRRLTSRGGQWKMRSNVA